MLACIIYADYVLNQNLGKKYLMTIVYNQTSFLEIIILLYLYTNFEWIPNNIIIRNTNAIWNQNSLSLCFSSNCKKKNNSFWKFWYLKKIEFIDICTQHDKLLSKMQYFISHKPCTDGPLQPWSNLSLFRHLSACSPWESKYEQVYKWNQ